MIALDVVVKLARSVLVTVDDCEVRSDMLRATSVTLRLIATAEENSTVPKNITSISGTYLIYAQVDYKYTPAVGYLIDKIIGIKLEDFTYTRPRQSLCVLYGTTVCPT